MKTYKFRTNINCGNCIKKVTPYLEQLTGLEWNVNTGDTRKVLEVKSTAWEAQQIIDKVKEAGYEIEPLKQGLWNRIFSR